MYRPQVTNVLNAINRWLSSANIGKTVPKRQAIAQELFWPIFTHGIAVEQIEAAQVSLQATPFQFAEGNVFEQLGVYMQTNGMSGFSNGFWKDIAEMTPTGLNTSPNACCGKYELLYRLVRPNASQPNKGDILDDGVVVELKGKEVRLSDPKLSGITYITQTNSIFADQGFTGNTTSTTRWKGQTVFEIEKQQYRDHYAKEFAKNPVRARQLLINYFIQNDFSCGLPLPLNELPSSAADGWLSAKCKLIVGDAGEFDQELLQRWMLTSFFKKYKEKQGFDKIIVFGDGTNVKFVETPDDLMKLEIYSDYFRIGQSANIGWYVR